MDSWRKWGQIFIWKNKPGCCGGMDWGRGRLKARTLVGRESGVRRTRLFMRWEVVAMGKRVDLGGRYKTRLAGFLRKGKLGLSQEPELGKSRQHWDWRWFMHPLCFPVYKAFIAFNPPNNPMDALKNDDVCEVLGQVSSATEAHKLMIVESRWWWLILLY